MLFYFTVVLEQSLRVIRRPTNHDWKLILVGKTQQHQQASTSIIRWERTLPVTLWTFSVNTFLNGGSGFLLAAVVQSMVKSESEWEELASFFEDVMSAKEVAERERSRIFPLLPQETQQAPMKGAKRPATSMRGIRRPNRQARIDATVFHTPRSGCDHCANDRTKKWDPLSNSLLRPVECVVIAYAKLLPRP